MSLPAYMYQYPPPGENDAGISISLCPSKARKLGLHVHVPHISVQILLQILSDCSGAKPPCSSSWAPPPLLLLDRLFLLEEDLPYVLVDMVHVRSNLRSNDLEQAPSLLVSDYFGRPLIQSS